MEEGKEIERKVVCKSWMTVKTRLQPIDQLNCGL